MNEVSELPEEVFGCLRVLGLRPNPYRSIEDVRSRFKELALQIHPDRSKSPKATVTNIWPRFGAGLGLAHPCFWCIREVSASNKHFHLHFPIQKSKPDCFRDFKGPKYINYSVIKSHFYSIFKRFKI